LPYLLGKLPRKTICITQLPIVRVPIDLLIYRMENFRTFSDQAEYMVREHKDSDYFKTGQENESVQQVQHEILVKLAEKGKANSVVPIIDVLRREGQREHLLITQRGVVVNGNRRLAAMRELYASENNSFANFSHVSCKALPADTTPDDILEIEGILQARPETRLDYDWIGDAELLSAMMKLKGTAESVARLLGRKVSEVKNSLQALSEAELYLKDWVNAEGEYGRVYEDGEQLFKDLPGQLQGKTSSSQDASRAIAWTLFENRDKLGGRLYNYNVTFGKRSDDVLKQLSEAVGMAPSIPASETAANFDFELPDDSTDVNYKPLISALKNDQSKAAAVASLVSICDNVIESEKDKKSGTAALKAISSANAKLAEIDLSRASRDTYDAIERQLESIGRLGAELLKKLSVIRAESPIGNDNSGPQL